MVVGLFRDNEIAVAVVIYTSISKKCCHKGQFLT